LCVCSTRNIAPQMGLDRQRQRQITKSLAVLSKQQHSSVRYMKRFFYHLKLLTLKEQICGKVFVCRPMNRMTGLILLFVRLVFRRYEYCNFLQLFLQLPTASEIKRIYAVRCFKLVGGILYCNLFLFYMQLFTAIFIK